MNSLHKILFIGAIAFSSTIPFASAGTFSGITWGTPTGISGANEVRNDGTLVYAYLFGNATSQTFNGVTFTGVTFSNWIQTVNFGGNSIYETNGNQIHSLSTFALTPPFVLLSNNNLLSHAIVSEVPQTMQLTLNGLQAGETYEFQWWANDANNISAANYQYIQAVDVQSVTLNTNTTNAAGGVGQYVIGTFTATGSSEEIDFSNTANGSYGPLINAFELRDVTDVPEPSTWALLAGGLGTLCFLRRKLT